MTGTDDDDGEVGHLRGRSCKAATSAVAVAASTAKAALATVETCAAVWAARLRTARHTKTSPDGLDVAELFSPQASPLGAARLSAWPPASPSLATVHAQLDGLVADLQAWSLRADDPPRTEHTVFHAAAAPSPDSEGSSSVFSSDLEGLPLSPPHAASAVRPFPTRRRSKVAPPPLQESRGGASESPSPPQVRVAISGARDWLFKTPLQQNDSLNAASGLTRSEHWSPQVRQRLSIAYNRLSKYPASWWEGRNKPHTSSSLASDTPAWDLPPAFVFVNADLDGASDGPASADSSGSDWRPRSATSSERDCKSPPSGHCQAAAVAPQKDGTAGSARQQRAAAQYATIEKRAAGPPTMRRARSEPVSSWHEARPISSGRRSGRGADMPQGRGRVPTGSAGEGSRCNQPAGLRHQATAVQAGSAKPGARAPASRRPSLATRCPQARAARSRSTPPRPAPAKGSAGMVGGAGRSRSSGSGDHRMELPSSPAALALEMGRRRRLDELPARKRFFYSQCLRWHPDKNTGDEARATRMFQLLQEKKDWFLSATDTCWTTGSPPV